MLGKWHKSQHGNKKQMFQQRFKTRVKYSQPDQRVYTLEGSGVRGEESKRNRVMTEANFDDQQMFQRTACKLEKSNFSHHKVDACFCSECTCGRHLCKLHVVKPNMTKNTVYQKSFYRQEPMKKVLVVSKEYDKLKGPHLEMSSTYRDGFDNKNGSDVERAKPEDLLSSEGPAQQLTSYSIQYPGHHGQNQYVKPTDRHIRGKFPLRSKSTYSGNFMRRKSKKDDYKYIPDQLKTGIYDWLGSTTYNNNFVQPNPEYIPKKVKQVQSRNQKVGNKLQFKTTYKSDFLGKGSTVCPAKVQLETKDRDSYSENKHRFSENSDFKTISKNFAAISTSKHSFI